MPAIVLEILWERLIVPFGHSAALSAGSQKNLFRVTGQA